jgi:hypothetical protein
MSDEPVRKGSSIVLGEVAAAQYWLGGRGAMLFVMSLMNVTFTAPPAAKSLMTRLSSGPGDPFAL